MRLSWVDGWERRGLAGEVVADEALADEDERVKEEGKGRDGSEGVKL